MSLLQDVVLKPLWLVAGRRCACSAILLCGRSRQRREAKALVGGTIASVVLCCSPDVLDEIRHQWIPADQLADNHGDDEAGWHVSLSWCDL